MTLTSLLRTSYLTAPAALTVLLYPAFATAQIEAGAPSDRDAPVATGYDDEDDTDFDDDEIIVSAQRRAELEPLRTEIPDVTFGAGDIQALGVTDLNELLEAIQAETGSTADAPPVLLLDGRPVASRRDIKNFPSEAVRKVDILAPEAALRYSSDPGRRVINFVLRKRFNATTIEADAGTSIEGGQDTVEGGVNYLRIRNSTRLAFNGSLKTQSEIRQDERDISDRNAGRLFATGGNIEGAGGGEIDPELSALAGETVTQAGVPAGAASGPFTLADVIDTQFEDQRRFRDLTPDTHTLSLGGSVFRPIGDHLSINTAISGDFTQSEQQRGVDNTRFDIGAGNPFSPFANDVTYFRSAGPLIRDREVRDIDASASLFGDYARLRWEVSAGYAHIKDVADTDRSLSELLSPNIQDRIDAGDADLNPFGPLGLLGVAATERTTDTLTLKSRLNAQVYTLPAGPVTLAAGLEFAQTDLSSLSDFNGETINTDLPRTETEARATLNIPLTGSGGRRAAGRTRLRLSGSVDSVEDFGTLKSYGAGLNWNVTDKLELQASSDIRERAPSLTQLGNPTLIDPNVRVTDFETGDSVFINRLTGGNPDLKAETRRDIQITAKYRVSREFQMSSRYRARRTDNDLSAFPFLTPQVAQAFPDRLTRDEDGNLTDLDARPVNAFRSQVDFLRSGLNWRKRFPRTAGSDAKPQTETESRGSRRRRGPSDSVSVSLYHTWRLTEDFQLQEDGEAFDLLGGSALRRQGGEAEHEVQLRLSGRVKNYGGRFTLNQETGSTINIDSLGASQGRGGDLTFDPLTTADLRLYYDLGRRANGRPVPRGSLKSGLRLSFDINNIGDSKQSVSNTIGQTPFGYEGDALDPQGRTVMFSLRKIFMSRPNRGEGGRSARGG